MNYPSNLDIGSSIISRYRFWKFNCSLSVSFCLFPFPPHSPGIFFRIVPFLGRIYLYRVSDVQRLSELCHWSGYFAYQPQQHFWWTTWNFGAWSSKKSIPSELRLWLYLVGSFLVLLVDSKEIFDSEFDGVVFMDKLFLSFMYLRINSQSELDIIDWIDKYFFINRLTVKFRMINREWIRFL